MRQPARRPDGGARPPLDGGRRQSRRSSASPASTRRRRRGRRPWSERRRSPSRAPRHHVVGGPALADRGRSAARRARTFDPSPRRATGSPRPCCSRTATTARRCRCCSTPTAVRTRSGSSPRRDAYAASQWFADQGFAVVVADGRGTPGRGQRVGASGPPRSRRRRCSTTRSTPCTRPPSDIPQLDLDRVAIRGWSFGGYLAALAVLRRPDVFHAAIAGAPVTEWRLYDTHYTERYLGDPDRRSPRRTTGSSLLPLAARLDPTAAADPRSGRRQRGRRPHAAAVAPPCSPPAGRTRCCRCRRHAT